MISPALVDLLYRVSKQPWAECNCLVWVALTGVQVDRCLALAVRTGKSNLLKLMNEHFKHTPEFESVVVRCARERFSQLRLERQRYEGAVSEAKVKQLVSPVILVLVLRPELLPAILSEYLDICSEGAAYFESKVEQILQQIVKSREQVRETLAFLFGTFRDSPIQLRVASLVRRVANTAKLHPGYYRAFHESLFELHRDQRSSFDKLHPFLEVQVLFDFVVLAYESHHDYFAEHLKGRAQEWRLKPEDFFKFTAFTERQFSNFGLCARFTEDLIEWNLPALNLRGLYGQLFEEFLKKDGKDPSAFPVMLAFIALKFAVIERARGSPIDVFFSVFKEGILCGQLGNPVFWSQLVAYCCLDRILSETIVRGMIPESRQKEFIQAVNSR